MVVDNKMKLISLYQMTLSLKTEPRIKVESTFPCRAHTCQNSCERETSAFATVVVMCLYVWR